MPKPQPVNQINISHVYVSESVLLTRAQKFPGGFVCNLPRSNQALMQTAADALDIVITFPAPHQRDPKEYVGVVTDIEHYDPEPLLDKYYALNIERANAARTSRLTTEPTHAQTQSRRRRTHAHKNKVSTAARRKQPTKRVSRHAAHAGV